MTGAERGVTIAGRIARAIAVALAAAAVASLAGTLTLRFFHPYDLEWMEGGVLCHALRLSKGQPIYAPPSVDFIPFLYTPLYPALVALLGRVLPLGYQLGRGISLVGFGVALLCAHRLARHAGASRLTASMGMALPCAAYVPTGAWYDLARPDSLYLGLVVSALYLGWTRRHSHAWVAASAALMVAAFFTKQTASPFLIALGLALLVARWRVVPTYVATLALLGLPILWWLHRSTEGWFWKYVFELHQSHDFYAVRAYVGTPGRLALLIGPALVVIPWALTRKRSPDLLYAVWLALVGIAIACVGYGTKWAFTNAFIPGVFFPAIAVGAGLGVLTEAEAGGGTARRSMVAWTLTALALAMAPGGLQRGLRQRLPRAWWLDPNEPAGYDPRPFIPAREDRRRGDALIARLRATPGEVLIPFHPFYAHLAGKRSFVHRMGVLDVGFAQLPVRGLQESFNERRFSLVIMDDKIDGNWFWWPGLLANYQIAERIDGPRVVSGSPTSPRYLLTPKAPSGTNDAVEIDREIQ